MAAAMQVVDHPTTAHVRKDAHSKAAEQTTEISTEFIDREFSADQDEPGTRSTRLEFILQQMHTVLTDLTIGERHCCQLAEEPLEEVATTAEEV